MYVKDVRLMDEIRCFSSQNIKLKLDFDMCRLKPSLPNSITAIWLNSSASRANLISLHQSQGENTYRIQRYYTRYMLANMERILTFTTSSLNLILASRLRRQDLDLSTSLPPFPLHNNAINRRLGVLMPPKHAMAPRVSAYGGIRTLTSFRFLSFFFAIPTIMLY